MTPQLEVFSAGTAPRVNPYAVRAMKEVGIDISGGTPKNVREFLAQSLDYVITVCEDADKNCPDFRGKVGKRLHIGFPDPAKATGSDEEKLAVFRRVRDDIRLRFYALYEKELREGAGTARGRSLEDLTRRILQALERRDEPALQGSEYHSAGVRANLRGRIPAAHEDEHTASWSKDLRNGRQAA